MRTKKKILIGLGAIILLVVFSLIALNFVFKTKSKTIDSFLFNIEKKSEEKAERKAKGEGGKKRAEEAKKYREESEEKAKLTKLNTEENPIVIPSEIDDSKSYKKAWEYITVMNRTMLLLDTFDGLGSEKIEMEGVGIILSKPGFDLIELQGEGVYFAISEAFYNPLIRWEVKWLLSQVLGERNEKRALPMFRSIATDENEQTLLRVTAFDQMRTFKDRDSYDIAISMMDDKLPIIRDKASVLLRDIAERGDEYAYEQTLAHYYNEQELNARECLIGTAMSIGGEKSFADIREIIKKEDTDKGDKEIIAINLGDFPCQESFEMLKELYSPQDDNLTMLVTDSMAKLEMDESNQFLYDIVEEANGIISVMAAGDLVNHRQIEAIPYIQKALAKETNPEFINNYQEFLNKLGIIR